MMRSLLQRLPKNKHCQQVAFVDDQFLAKFNSELLMYRICDDIFYGHSLY